MSAFLRYQLLNYIRSYRFIAPTTIFLAWVFISYAYKNIPVLSSYATTSIALYMIMTWISMNVFSLEDTSEKHILYVNLGSKQKFFWGKFLVCIIFILLLTIFAHFFPIVNKNFKGDVLFIHHFLSLYSHILLGILGVFVGSFFSSTRISSTRNAWLLSALVIVLTIGQQSIIDSMPFLTWIFVIFPPVTRVLLALSSGDDIIIDAHFWFDFSWVIAYASISMMAVLWLFLKSERS